MLQIAEGIHLGAQKYSDRLKLKLRTGMSHEELDKMFDAKSAIMSVVRASERSISETYGCKD